MVLPAMFGCDTISSFYSHLLVQTLVPGKWTSLRREMDVFKDPGSTHEQIHEAGLKIVAAHFSTDKAALARSWMKRERSRSTRNAVASQQRGVANLSSLVLYEDSVYLHLDRAYFQIQDWQGNALEPTDYGWKIKDGLLESIPMKQDAAPVCLMEVPQCKCKATKCTSGRCSCYRKLRDV